MGDQLVDLLVDQVAFRAEQWWCDNNSLKTAVDNLNVPASLKDWIMQIAIQSWTEGAITSVQEYGDELREINETFDLSWEAQIDAVKLWRKENPGNELTLPDERDLTRWLLKKAFPEHS